MRLTKIKLAGFKSFVDPVTVHLPGNLVGIVGPNGCGKSNIIDAVRWVMGESSARHLRGESMTDVIFNGSATRKPVGQASIELVFDNSAGQLGGPWAGYNEISIRRLVSRDGQSSYFLNNVRCRRRDITDIFLGTGLGPRSYAIIGQGMISRVIESRPEELRIFLEEAAGISKYKERRRETENRIRHTREHLDRLKDVREELIRQLQHLQRQAQAAEQYQQYRAEERRLKVELLALRWQVLSEDLAVRERLIREQETALEALIAEQRNTDAQREAGRVHQEALTEQLSQVQARFYQTGMEIARLEQTLQHQRQLHQRQTEELGQVEQDLEKLQKDIRLDEARLGELEGAMARDEPALEATRAVEAEIQERLELAEAAMQDWQSVWEEFSHRQANARREADLTRTRIEHLEHQLSLQERRVARLQLERQDLTTEELAQDLEDLERQAQNTEQALSRDQSMLSGIDRKIANLRQSVQHLTLVLDEIRKTIQARRGRLASLEALQEAALGRHQAGINGWLQERQLDKAPRLAEQIDVEPGWERAVETVLGHHLQAVCTGGLALSAADLTTLEQGSLTLLDTAIGTADEQTRPQADGLSAKVRSSWPLDGLLFGVQVAADFDEASIRRGELRDHESLITPEGIWLGRHWLRVVREGKENEGVLGREREIRSLRVSLEQDIETSKQQAEVQERMQAESANLEQQRGSIQKAINEGHREHARLQGQINTRRARLEQVLIRRGVIDEELEELNRQVERDREVLQEARQGLEEALLSMERLSEEHEVLLEQRERLRHDLEEARAQVQSARQETQQQALAVESQRSALSSTRQALERLKARQSQLQGRREQLVLGLAAEDQPLGDIQSQLEALLEDRINTERQLEERRRTVEEQDIALRALEKTRAAADRRVQELRQTLEAQRLGRGEVSVRRQTVLDQLQDMDTDLDTVLAHLPAQAQESRWQARIEKVGTRIQRLGAINLAAIEEFSQLSERKLYLDSQNDDLVEALTTLENAMRKIDRDSRSRFKDTFDRVNQKLQELFPRLFEGGQAYLTLTGEDLLSAGVTIMAQPPGKRIGNIHLLSGGEKALTAVALVFALFQLNPAPFCMLDEVDAPLDEANVSRFGRLVQEMSKQVQFIFITHNKGTMEIAGQLAGVTMQEPGVSRLVAVDVDEAVQLAAV